ncbi:MAG: tetratricopeptide repeat protein [Bacteroidota bacterium]
MYLLRALSIALLLRCSLPLQAQPPLIHQALVAFDKDDLEQAQTAIDQATSQAATSGPAWYYRGAIYEALLRKQISSEEAPELFAATLASYRQALALTPPASQFHSFAQINLNNLWAYYLDRGRRYYRQENFDKAVEQWQYCEQIRTDQPCVELYKAIAAHQDEQYALARQHYTQYLTQATTVPAPVYRGLAQVTAQLDQHAKQALLIIEQALQQYPFDNDLLAEQLALYQVGDGEKEALPQRLAKKLAAAPHDPALYYQLGYWYEQQGQPAQALLQYQQAATLAPHNIEPMRQQGIVHYNQAAQLTQTIEAMPAEAFQEKGMELRQALTKHLAQALACFKQARKRQPRDLFTLKHLQTLYLRLKKPAKAAKIERKLWKYKP